ncbi:MAG: hypothetical protein ACRDQ5_26505 [Sciscionella sp.]
MAVDEATDLLDAFSSRNRTSVGATERGQMMQPQSRYTTSGQDGDHFASPTREWRIPCQDVIGRDRCLTVLVRTGQVVVVSPPGETAVLTPGQLGQLRTALQEAAEQAERQR